MQKPPEGQSEAVAEMIQADREREHGPEPFGGFAGEMIVPQKREPQPDPPRPFVIEPVDWFEENRRLEQADRDRAEQEALQAEPLTPVKIPPPPWTTGEPEPTGRRARRARKRAAKQQGGQQS